MSWKRCSGCRPRQWPRLFLNVPLRPHIGQFLPQAAVLTLLGGFLSQGFRLVQSLAGLMPLDPIPQGIGRYAQIPGHFLKQTARQHQIHGILFELGVIAPTMFANILGFFHEFFLHPGSPLHKTEETSNRESQNSWREFLLQLKERGLHGVQFIVSDDHPGLKAAK